MRGSLQKSWISYTTTITITVLVCLPPPAYGSDAAPNPKANQVEVVVVTAEKRQERLQDVPAPVTALNTDTLVNTNQNRIQDFYLQVPGLNYTNDNRGAAALSIRGLTTSLFENPTVATLIDDEPYTVTTSAANGWGAIELDPNELSQIEVLRGPQGVLYGAASLGGIIKYQTIQPSTDDVSGRVMVGVNGVQNSGQLGYAASGAINLPLSDDFAVRVAAFGRNDAGYIDNTLTGQNGINHGYLISGRASALWQPTDNFSLRLSALIQDSRVYGSTLVEGESIFTGLPLGDLQQSNIRGSGDYTRRIEAYSATTDAQLGDVHLTAVTGFTDIRNKGNFDMSYLLVPFGFPPVEWLENNHITKFNQELRLTGTVWSSLDWMLGGFFTHEMASLDEGPGFFQPLTGVPTGRFYQEFPSALYTEYSVFANVDYHLTDALDVQLGGRYSYNEQSFSQITQYSFPAPITLVAPKAHTSDSSFTYLVAPRWKINPDFMVYARLSSGYRPGGPNALVQPGSGLPTSFGPDTTTNYEIGLKGDFFDHTLSIDTSAYYIDWRDVQITVISVPFQPYSLNAAKARSQGIELSVQSTPWDGMSVSATAALSDARLGTTLPASLGIIAHDNDSLSYTSPFSGNASFTQQLPLAVLNDAPGYVGLSISYVGERQGEFATPGGAARPILPAYTKVDLRAGAQFDTWNVSLYANNVGDERGVLQAGQGFNIPGIYTFIQPRTFGVNVSRQF